MTQSEHDRERWEEQFRQGGWDFLKSERQLPRYGVLCAYMKGLGRPISLLDVGCGEGLILKFCSRDWLLHYWGLDISQSGLDRIKTVLPTDRLICSPLEQFSTEQRFDVILFNEVLYYTAEPETYLDRFRNYLNPGGVFLISTSMGSAWFPRNNSGIRSIWRGWFSRNSRSIRSVWRLVKHCKWEKIDEVLIKSIPDNTTWRIALIRPRPGTPCW